MYFFFFFLLGYFIEDDTRGQSLLSLLRHAAFTVCTPTFYIDFFFPVGPADVRNVDLSHVVVGQHVKTEKQECKLDDRLETNSLHMLFVMRIKLCLQ